MKISVRKTNRIYHDVDKDGKKKDPKYLWVLSDEHNHTVIQAYDDRYPTKLVKLFE